MVAEFGRSLSNLLVAQVPRDRVHPRTPAVVADQAVRPIPALPLIPAAAAETRVARQARVRLRTPAVAGTQAVRPIPSLPLIPAAVETRVVPQTGVHPRTPAVAVTQVVRPIPALPLIPAAEETRVVRVPHLESVEQPAGGPREARARKRGAEAVPQ